MTRMPWWKYRWVFFAVVITVTLVWALSPRLQSADATVGAHPPMRWRFSSSVVHTSQFSELATPKPPPEMDAPIPTVPQDWKKAHVAIYSVATLTPKPRAPTLQDLNSEAQAHAIDVLGQDGTGESHRWEEIRAALTDSSDSPGTRDPFQFDRVLVATVTKGADWEPGERMMWTRVFVQPINFVFGGYTIASTENEAIKVTSVEATTTRRLSADVSLTVPGLEGSKIGVSPSNETNVRTNADVNAQYEKLGIDIKPEFLRIVRESETGGDVLGNTTIALSVLTDSVAMRKKFPTDHTPPNVPADKIVLLVKSALLMNKESGGDFPEGQATINVVPQIEIPHCALRARVWMLFQQRHIDNGREFYDEAQQDVHLIRDADPKREVDIVNADDVSPAVWSIQIVSKDDRAKFLTGYVPASDTVPQDGEKRELVFTDYSTASSLAHWLRRHYGAKLSGLQVDYDGKTSLIPVKKVRDECQQNLIPDDAKDLYHGEPAPG